MQQNHFLLLKKLKNTSSAQLWLIKNPVCSDESLRLFQGFVKLNLVKFTHSENCCLFAIFHRPDIFDFEEKVFFNLFNKKKLFVAFFTKLIWLGVGFSNRTGAEIGY